MSNINRVFVHSHSSSDMRSIIKWISWKWPAAGSADTELGVMMEPEVCHGEAEVYTRIQA